MSPSFRPLRPPLSIIASAAALCVLAPSADAQRAGNGFFFNEPRGSLAIRGGFAQARGGSDIFSFVTNQLTLGKSDFGGASIEADLAFRANSRLDIVIGSGYTGSRARSEFREFVDDNDLPIEQTTSLFRVPLTASARLYLVPRGQSIGRYAWIPSKLVPFLGVGAGAMWYSFRQEGDFVNLETMDIFPDVFRSSGWTPTAHANAGIDLGFGLRYGLTGEARYVWARAPLSNDFSGFDRIDLSGYNLSMGFYVRF